MKINKSALVGLALSAISFASHAGYTASLSGPSALRPGDSGTFTLMLQYTPRILNQLDDLGTGVPGAFQWSQTTHAYPHMAHFYKDGVEYIDTSTPLWFYTSFNTDPAFISPQFVWTAGAAGTYDINFAVDTIEYVTHTATALCMANPSCARQSAYLNGTDEVFSVIPANFRVNVTPTAPIPEPETFALMLAGLGLMGTVARRRKK